MSIFKKRTAYKCILRELKEIQGEILLLYSIFYYVYLLYSSILKQITKQFNFKE